MKRFSAVVFPDTVPSSRVLIPLVPVFDQVVYCQPVENDDSTVMADARCAELVNRSLCVFHAPAPLGENRERFLRLVKDLRERRDDYAAQLAHVSLAGMSAGSRHAVETGSSILSSLLSGHDIDSAGQQLREKLLWQARLVLKLGEQFDTDQQQVDADMLRIHQRERQLFSGLSEGGDNLFALTGRISSPVPDVDRMQRLRLKAWARMFAFGSDPVAGSVFISTDRDAVDRLCEEHERSSGAGPAAFPTLSLPFHCRDAIDFFDMLQRFRSEKEEIVTSVADMIDAPSSMSDQEAAALNGALDDHFPREKFGRCQLDLFAFPGIRVKRLFLDSFGHDEDELETVLAGEEQQDKVIGLLTEQEGCSDRAA